MPIPDIYTLALIANGVLKAITTGIDLAKKIVGEKKLGEEERNKASEFLEQTAERTEILSLLRETLQFLFALLPEAAKLHAFSDKLREMIVSTGRIFEGDDSEEKDKHWTAILNLFGTIGHIKETVDNISQHQVTLPDSKEMGILLQSCDSFNLSFKSASNYITARDHKLLESCCESMATHAANIRGLVKKYLQDLVQKVFE